MWSVQGPLSPSDLSSSRALCSWPFLLPQAALADWAPTEHKAPLAKHQGRKPCLEQSKIPPASEGDHRNQNKSVK